MNRFANLADQIGDAAKPAPSKRQVTTDPPPSRIGRKAISGYFSPELSMALHHCARKHDLSLQALMAEAFNDVLRKYGESPVGG
jgi:hypothetical protein